jgi:hypothetical protein
MAGARAIQSAVPPLLTLYTIPKVIAEINRYLDKRGPKDPTGDHGATHEISHSGKKQDGTSEK